MLNILHRHVRWEERLDSYVDGELPAPHEQKLVRHLAGCDPCREALTARRAVKQLVAALPETPAPRSFRLTSAMVAAAAPAPARPRPARSTPAAFAMRTAWMTAAVAAFAVALVAVLDATSTSGPASEKSVASSPAMESAPRPARAADTTTAGGQALPSTTDGAAFAASPTAAATPGSVKAAGARDGSPTPDNPDAPVVAPPAAGDTSSADGGISSVSGPGEPPAVSRAATPSDDDAQVRALEAALGALALLAAGVAAVITIRLRRSS
ncbi:MAG: zf-HC2 domain-containing protein [Dehalococcoidia bacterium]|nr:zf-HC2 domain-containing protein [Dehalococcoidia bacterium]